MFADVVCESCNQPARDLRRSRAKLTDPPSPWACRKCRPELWKNEPPEADDEEETQP